MAEIINFIKKCEVQDIDVFLNEDAIWPDVEASQTYLTTISKAEREHVFSSLKNIVEALRAEETRILGQKNHLQKQMVRREKTQSACIAYLDGARNLKNKANT